MPRAKDSPSTSTEPEHGFAALEAKVEEVQLEAAIAGEAASESLAAVAPLMIQEGGLERGDPVSSGKAPDVAAPQFGSPSAATLLAPLPTICSTFMDCTESVLRLQTDTFRSLAKVRGPQDLVSLQIEYGRQALELYTSNMARLTKSGQALGR